MAQIPGTPLDVYYGSDSDAGDTTYPLGSSAVGPPVMAQTVGLFGWAAFLQPAQNGTDELNNSLFPTDHGNTYLLTLWNPDYSSITQTTSDVLGTAAQDIAVDELSATLSPYQVTTGQMDPRFLRVSNRLRSAIVDLNNAANQNSTPFQIAQVNPVQIDGFRVDGQNLTDVTQLSIALNLDNDDNEANLATAALLEKALEFIADVVERESLTWTGEIGAPRG